MCLLFRFAADGFLQDIIQLEYIIDYSRNRLGWRGMHGLAKSADNPQTKN